MNEQPQLDNTVISDDDGLTDQEREFLKTPVKDVPPEYRAMLINVREKKDKHTYAENEKWRLAREKEREDKEAADDAAEQDRIRKKEEVNLHG